MWCAVLPAGLAGAGLGRGEMEGTLFWGNNEKPARLELGANTSFFFIIFFFFQMPIFTISPQEGCGVR